MEGGVEGTSCKTPQEQARECLDPDQGKIQGPEVMGSGRFQARKRRDFPEWRSGKNPTRNHEFAGWIPGLAQLPVKDLALP